MRGGPDGAGNLRDLGFPLFLAAVTMVAVLSGLFEGSPASGRGRLGLAGVLLALLLAFVTAIAVHEAGHVVAGLLVGLRPVLIAVGPVHLAFTATGPRLHLDVPMRPGLYVSLPLWEEHLRYRAILLSAGGPVSGLLLAGAALAAKARLMATSGITSPLAASAFLYLESMAVISGLTAVASLLPPTGKEPVPTDGERIGMLVRGGAKARGWCALIALDGASMRGIRPRDWSQTTLAEALAPVDGTTRASALLMAYYARLDQGDAAEAGGLLDRALAVVEVQPGLGSALCYCEAAYYAARYRHDAAAARARLDKVPAVPGWLVPRHTRLRAEAAVLLAEGEHALAAAATGQGLAAAERTWERGLAQAEKEWLLGLLEAALENSPTP